MRKKNLQEIEQLVFGKFGDNITVLEYTKMSSKGKFKCNIHNVEFYTMPRDIIGRGTGCEQCANEGRRKKHSFSFDYVKSFIESKKCVLISTEYLNCDLKLDVIFECGHNGSITFWNFKEGVRCPICSVEIVASQRRLGKEEVERRINEKGLEILDFIGDYLNTNSKVKTKCSQGHIEIHEISSLLYSCTCKQCSFDKISFEKRGIGGSNWQGGKSSIIDFLHKQLKEWKKDSLDASHHRCLICEETKGLHIHHIYNFTNILNNAFRELNLRRRLFIFEYTTDEINSLLIKVQELHNQQFLGVALCRRHHQEFHFWYGRYNNSLEQLEDYIEYCKEEKDYIWKNNKPKD